LLLGVQLRGIRFYLSLTAIAKLRWSQKPERMNRLAAVTIVTSRLAELYPQPDTLEVEADSVFHSTCVPSLQVSR
jgi:hypothetical protein